MSQLTETPSWQALWSHFRDTREVHMRDQFREDAQRFDKFSLPVGGLLLDYSKNRINEDTMRLLVKLAEERGMKSRIEAMFNGEKINFTEKRAVLHVALRNRTNAPIFVDGENIMPKVNAVLDRMCAFAHSVRSGDWLGYTGQPITDVVSIGIGGSDLGPQMVYEALKPYAHPRMKMHFVSNVDGSQIAETLKEVHPATTLFVIESKTFTTQETLTNAKTAREWFLAAAKDEKVIAKHFVAVSTNRQKVIDFGIDPQNMFEFWDWVGGRFSVWSSIGLPIVLALGRDHFYELLNGAHIMDQHFRNAPLERNMPVILGMLGIWYMNFYGGGSHVIAPYDQYLHRFPAYVQQLDMESNGKQVNAQGGRVDHETAPIIWGETGINGQHAFYQLLHQGTHISPIDLICSTDGRHSMPGHHDILLSNVFAQAQAFMQGKTADEVREEMQAAGVPADELEALVPHRVFDGNRPTNTILLSTLDARNLGALIALYEHKIFVQGTIWGINSFDQWGVELGKQLAKKIHAQLVDGSDVGEHDCSTRSLIEYYRKHKPRR